MKKVVVLATGHTVASTFAGPLDVFNQSGVLWNRVCGMPKKSAFDVELVTTDGEPFPCAGGFMVQPNRSLHDVTDADLIVISSIGNISDAMLVHRETIPWLRRHHSRGAHLASVCTGAFLLAETGLLEGKKATTHWGFASLFRRRYPKVDLKPERMITDEGNLLCSAGFMAGVDLSLYLVGKYCGRDVKLQCAKAMIYDINRSSQSPYSRFRAQKKHRDTRILSAQTRLEDHYSEKFNLDQLARQVGMSIRTFERRFKAATGDTPTVYLQRLRVESAKRQLEETEKTFDEITYDVGYEDSSFFRKVFVRHTGLRPQRYRRKFRNLS